MKTLVVYYSYSGSTKAIAGEYAKQNSVDITEIKGVKRPWKLRAYTAGILASMKGKAWPIEPPEVDFESYERLVLFAPVWAGNPAPMFNAVLELLPQGKTVDVKMVSKSGNSACKERLEAVISSKGSVLESFEDVKS